MSLSIKVERTGPGFGRIAERFNTRQKRVGSAIGGLCVDIVKTRAFGPRGRGTDGKRHPPGVDLVRTGQMRRDYRVIRVRQLPRWVEAVIGVRGPSADYSDRVQIRRPWQALMKADMGAGAQALSGHGSPGPRSRRTGGVMSQEAPADRLLSLSEAVVPAIRPQECFVRLHKGSGRSGKRSQAAKPHGRIRQGLEYRPQGRERSAYNSCAPFLWVERAVFVVPYPVRGDAADLDALNAVIASDEAQIREAWQGGYTNAPKVIEHMRWDLPSEIVDERDNDGALIRRELHIPLTVEHYA